MTPTPHDYAVARLARLAVKTIEAETDAMYTARIAGTIAEQLAATLSSSDTAMLSDALAFLDATFPSAAARLRQQLGAR